MSIKPQEKENRQPESYPVRTSEVGGIWLINVALSASIQLGDRGETDARLRALAVQRQEDHLTAGQVYFEAYPIFRRKLPVLLDPVYDSGEDVRISRYNRSPAISVGCIRILAISSAASLLIGNSMRYKGDSRIKHIRQFASQPRASV